MAVKAEEQVTEAQAEEALRALSSNPDDEPEPAAQTEPEPTTEQAAETAPAADKDSDEPAPTDEAPPETDDVASLRKRLDEVQAQTKTLEETQTKRFQALQQRNAQNEQILRERFLRKSTVTDRALKTLRASRSADGVPEAEVDRVIAEIESTMNPASASYAPPESRAPVAEDQAIILNGFLNEKGMTFEEAEEFGKWISDEGRRVMTEREQGVARDSLDGFLRIAHTRWQEGSRLKDKEAKRNDAVDAVRSVQRTQRQAARAASVSTTASRKQPAGQSREIDYGKMTKDDVSALLKKSVEQYR